MADGLKIRESELWLDHVGYEGDQTRKHERNLPLLQAQLDAEPANSHNWAHLARVLDGLGRTQEAELALERAISVAQEVGLSVDVAAFLQLIRRRREHGEPVEALIDEALSWYPDNLGLAWEKAMAEMEAARYEDALRWLERLDADPEMPAEDTIAYPSEIFGARSAEARGLCLFKLGRYREAAAAYGHAEELEPGVEPHRLKRVLSEHRAASDGGSGEVRTSPFRWSARQLIRGLIVDVGQIPIRLSATDAVRAAAIREVLGRMPVSEREPLAGLRFSAHRLPLPAREPDEVQGDVELWHDDEALSISSRGEVTASVSAGHAEIGGFSRHLTVAVHHISPFILASLLAPHEQFLLHGGAIHRDGHGVLVLGDSGMGKSTLILGALQGGWDVLSDDLVLLRAGEDRPAMAGIPKALIADTEVVGEDVASWPRWGDARYRSYVQFEAWDRTRRPITAIVVVDHGSSERTVIEPLERPTLLGLLVRGMLCGQRQGRQAYMQLAMRLCDLPAYRLLHSRDPGGRALEATDALAARLAQDQRFDDVKLDVVAPRATD